jgi:hypothetical protein
VFCVLAYSIYYQLGHQPAWQTSLNRLRLEVTSVSTMSVISVIFLMLVNWGIEARKWQLSLNGVVSISFFTCFRAVFAGNAFALFTPNRTGEYFGRMLMLPRNVMARSVPVTIVCSISQIIATFAAGCVGMFLLKKDIVTYFGNSRTLSFWFDFLFYTSVIVLLVLTFSYFKVSMVSKLVRSANKLKALHHAIIVLEGFNATILLSILSLSIIRYLIFVVQYFMLFRIFGVGLNWWQAFWAVSVVFLVIAVIPAIGVLSELGVRWQTSIQLLQVYSTNITGIFATSLSVWLINLVIPAIIGGVLILALKLFEQQQETANLIVEGKPDRH